MEGSSPLKELIDQCKSRLTAFEQPIDSLAIAKGKYTQLSFRDLLKQTLQTIDSSKMDTSENFRSISTLTTKLSEYGILSSENVWTRRYFAERAYFTPWEKPNQHFIYLALDALFRKKGYAGGWEDPSVVEVKELFDKLLQDFSSIYPLLEGKWGEGMLAINEVAFKLGRLLIRLFYFEGLGVELLDAWKKYEQYLYISKGRYRDHFLHLVYDFFLGCRLLDGLFVIIKDNWKKYTGEDVTTDELRIRLMRIWAIVSFFHDIGYPAETLSIIRDDLEKTFFQKVPGFQLTPLKLITNDFLKEEVNDFLTVLAYNFAEDEYSFNFDKMQDCKNRMHFPDSMIFGSSKALFTDQLEHFDHGVASALFVLLAFKIDIHELTLESRQGITYKEMHDTYHLERAESLEDIYVAALAIAVHNIRKQVYRGLTADFRQHPIAFLLMLCDDLHEWDRQMANEQEKSSSFRSVYGFHVYPPISPSQLTDLLLGNDASKENLLTFLKVNLNAFGGKNSCFFDQYRASFREMAAILCHQKDSYQARIRIQEWIKQKKFDPKLHSLFWIIASSLTEYVVTIIYIGGNQQARGSPDDRISQFWNTLYDTYYLNLSNGPAICVLHGYDEDSVDLFFAARYSRSLKSYKIEEELKPKKQ